jgi:hypothetical protein
VFKKKERQDEIQFTTKIDGFLSFTPHWMLMYLFAIFFYISPCVWPNSRCWCCVCFTLEIILLSAWNSTCRFNSLYSWIWWHEWDWTNHIFLKFLYHYSFFVNCIHVKKNGKKGANKFPHHSITCGIFIPKDYKSNKTSKPNKSLGWCDMNL